VLTLAATGVLNAWRQAGSIGALTGSSYGTWLYVKLGLIAVVLLVAARTRRIVRRSPADTTAPGRTLTRLVGTEVAVMVLVLGATTGLVASAPPRQVATQPETATAVVDNRIAQVTVDPPVAGGTTMHLYLTSATGALQQPTQITVQASLPSHQINDLDLTSQLQSAGPGHLTGSNVVFPIPGGWTITITARYGEFDSTTFTLSLTIH
jgi:copper transport protein